MASDAYGIFERLAAQVVHIRDVAVRETAAGHPESTPVLLRTCLVLTVAGFDSYIHEQGVRLLVSNASAGATEASAVAAYVGLPVADVTGPSAQGLIRYRLSFKTLVSPTKVDDLFAAAGIDATDTWLKAAIAVGNRPERMRLQVSLQYDRRNQIAHEGDWDPIALDFRPIDAVHITDCTKQLHDVVEQFDRLLP